MRTIFEIDDHHFTTYRDVIGAVQWWVDRTVADGGRPSLEFDASGAYGARPGDVGDEMRWTEFSTTTVCGHWKLTGASWKHLFHSIVADAAGTELDGDAAEAALAGTGTTASTRVRVVIFRMPPAGPGDDTDRVHAIAATASPTAVHLLDPRSGLFEFPAHGTGNPIDDFTRHMTQVYGDDGGAIECRSYVVAVTDVFFTWFGRPRLVDKDGKTFALAVRPDVKGPARLAQASFGSHPRPGIKFFCERSQVVEYERTFLRLLGEDGPRVEVMAIEDHLDFRAAAAMSAPDFDDLPRTVAHIVGDSIDNPANFRALTNAKNVWSFYVLYRYGGYHLDTGVVVLRPNNVPATVTLPTPTTFGTMFLADRKFHYRHMSAGLGASGLACAAVYVSPFLHLEQLWDFDRVRTRLRKEETFASIDVGVIRAPAEAVGAERALRLYIDSWFRISRQYLSIEGFVRQNPNETDESLATRRSDVLKATYREAVITAAATGLTHQRQLKSSCGYRVPTQERDELFLPRDLGLMKTGESSHR